MRRLSLSERDGSLGRVLVMRRAKPDTHADKVLEALAG
jgi:hypothetical protein